MCFSAEADFVSGAVIGAIGIATLTQVERPREIPLAILPLAFALHQIAEGFVWRDLDSGVPRSTGVPVYLADVIQGVALLTMVAGRLFTVYRLRVVHHA